MNTTKQFLACGLISMFLVNNAAAQTGNAWIVGGEEATEGQFPFVGDMRLMGNHICGSVLIDPYWLLTAGHCVYDVFGNGQNLPLTSVRYRFNSIYTNGTLNADGGVERTPNQFFVHPVYVQSQSQNPGGFFEDGHDICLVKLTQPILTIAPLVLPSISDTAQFYSTGYPVKIAGWGLYDTANQNGSNALKHCNTKVFDFANCNAIMGGVSTKSFCAGYTSSEEEAGAAAGDSGGPVWVEHNGQLIVTGLVSGGAGSYTLPDTPGVYTKVAAFRPWIDSIIQANGGYSLALKKQEKSAKDIRISQNGQQLSFVFGQIEAKNVHCEIYNAEGRSMYFVNIDNPSGRSYPIDSSDWATGLYFVRFSDAKSGWTYTQKIAKRW